MEKENNSTVKAVSFMMIITLVGKILGLIRDQLLAGNYSVGMEASAFLTASRIPRIFFDVVFASAISASFIPVFNEYMKKRGKQEAFRLSNNFITVVLMLTSVITVFGMIFAPQLTELFADGFDEQTAALCTSLLRILFPATIFTGLAFSFVGILQSMDEFNVPAAMSIASNLVIIIYYIVFNKKFGIYGLTVAFLIGWAAQAIVQLPSLIKKGFIYKPYFKAKDEGLKKIIMLMLPVMVSTWIQPINLAINTRFASRLFEGSGVSAIEYANTLYSIIVGVFVLSIANVIFPKLSRMTVDNDSKKFGNTVGLTIRVMMFFVLPMMAGLMCLTSLVVNIIYMRGAFTEFASLITSKALFFFTPGMVGFAVQAILSRAFYAEQNGKIPLISGIISIGVNVALCVMLTEKMDVGGLAFASAVSQSVSAVVLVVPMQKKNKIFDKEFVCEVIKMIICTVIMAAVVIAVKAVALPMLPSGFIGNVICASVCVALGGAVYAVLSYILKIQEALMAVDMIFKILRKERKNK